jgi:hypothetical protein
MKIDKLGRAAKLSERSASVFIWSATALAAVSFGACGGGSSSMENPQASSGSGATTSGTGALAGMGAGAGATIAGAAGQGRASAGSGVATRAGNGGAGTAVSSTGAAGRGQTAGSAAVGGKGAAAGASAVGASGTTGSAGTAASGTDCTRDSLKTGVDQYYAALAAHDPSMLQTAMTVKFTENGKVMQLGDGMWKMAGMVKFKRSALDTTSCNSVTESVVPEGTTDRIFGLRLKHQDQQVTEVETIVVRDGDYILNNPSALAATSKDDWETVLPADQQASRDQLMMLMNTYFTKFPSGACNFASDCVRLEDGGSVGGCTGSGITCAMTSGGSSGGMMGVGGSMKPRLFVLDVDAGISVGFAMFAGTYTDFHLFKVRMGEVHGVHAVLASATSSGWD